MDYSVEKINEYVRNGKFDELIKFAEIGQKMQRENIIRVLKEKIGGSDDFCGLILVTGPSSSGKTTFSNLLVKGLSDLGYNANYISLDDYYNDVKITQRKQEKKGFVKTDTNDYDYECIDAFDVAKFRKNMKEFMAGKETQIPLFDFNLKRPNGIRKTIKRTGKDIIVVEGIQSMNKKLIHGLKFNFTKKIYICPFDYFTFEGERIIEPKFVRLMRRAVRNYKTRGHGISETLLMWENVRRSEEKDIKIHKKDADFIYNSGTPYEINYLAPIFLKMCENLPEFYEKRLKIFANIIVLGHIEPVDKLELPEEAIFREFY